MSEALTRQEMLPIMDTCGVLSHLDINSQDFLDEHHRASEFVAVAQLAYALGRAKGSAVTVPEAGRGTMYAAALEAYDASPGPHSRALLEALESGLRSVGLIRP